MSRIISALLLVVAMAAVPAFADEPPLTLVDNAPDRYIVVKGDTLWDISGRFLNEPWRWPEIWRLNRAQIKNPHLIYPGDIVLLDYADGRPRLRLGKPIGSGNVKLSPEVRSEQIAKAIPSIPPNAIEPFISRPLVVEANELADAPQLVGMDDNRVVIGHGDEIFALGISDDHPTWHIYRLGAALKNPVPDNTFGETEKDVLGPVETYMRGPLPALTPVGTEKPVDPAIAAVGKPGDVLGYEVVYLGTARLKELGEVSTLEVLTAREEILQGDLLMPAEEPTLKSYVPHVLEEEVVGGQVISVYGGVGVGSKFSIIALNLGENAGLEPGHVLGIYSKRTATYRDKSQRVQTIALPDKRNGVVFVFRVFGRVSYGLVMEAARPLVVGDVVRKP
ncbi:MAG: LysM peptidoglycan-binding domain-containing protein [Zoogloeaceae bacterium]|nr:LysM peptidoglycan-binding domain-containing protein [Zoogloeaceae bacterium]